jgi:hypothetical protein
MTRAPCAEAKDKGEAGWPLEDEDAGAAIILHIILFNDY